MAITWVKVARRAYVSACGRFQVRDVSGTSRARWVLTDNAARDACTPEYPWTRGATTLDSAKRKAARLLAGASRASV